MDFLKNEPKRQHTPFYGAAGILIAATFVLTLSSCTHTKVVMVGASYESKPLKAGAAEVCAFQKHILPVGTYKILDNGVLVGAISGQSHFCYQAKPGLHVVESRLYEKSRGPRIAIKLRAGKRYAFWNNASVRHRALCGIGGGFEENAFGLLPWAFAKPLLRELPQVGLPLKGKKLLPNGRIIRATQVHPKRLSKGFVGRCHSFGDVLRDHKAELMFVGKRKTG